MSPVPSPHQSQLLGHGSRKEKRMRKVDTFAPHNDGHQWRKYGEKKINNCNFPRYYYRCTYKDNMNCPATKQIQQKDHSDPPLYQVTYYNEHSCNSAFLALTPTEFQLQTASGKAVSICFDSSGAQEPGANASSPSSSAAPRGTPSESKNKPLALRSEALSSWAPGVVEQKTACADLQSCSTECQDAYISEDIDAGRFGSIRFFHFL
ncbi:hypothetical protein ACQJBY_032881 [Aegilops geniculata]